LRWLRDWILPRKSKATGAIRHVGGLSLQRIATIKSLYQVQKAFRMRPDPDDLRKNIPAKGDDSLTGFSQSVLETMERMRDQRVKQLASRIVEAALGIGVEQPNNDRKDPKRPRERIQGARFAPCHAVVIENLTNYRPEETRTRRENRQLMSWSSGKVRDYLTEACQLNGLHLREVSAAYTSRQDSRTGAPGVRCVDVPVTEFLESPFWKREVGRAEKKGHGNGDERDRYIVELRDLAEETRKVNPASLPKTFRIPIKGGDIFVSADRSSPAANGLQADLNAAANIGLKALLDPDWPGRWWYVPCITDTGKADPKSTKGSLAVIGDPVLLPAADDDPDSTKSATKRKTQKTDGDVTNAWRDASHRPLSDGRWHVYTAYQNLVLGRAVRILRSQLCGGEPTQSASPTA
jgi:IS605 OrfB family transposase